MDRRNDQRRGFTLIELLVVMALIGLLMSILIASLARARENARRVVCAKTVSQFIVGALIYAEEHNRRLPSGQSESGSDGSDEHTPVITRTTCEILVDLLDGHTALKCPWLNKPFDGEEGWYYPGYGFVLGYHYLGGHSGTPWQAGGWKSPQRNTDNGRLVLIAELNAWSDDARTFAPHGIRGPINRYHEPSTGGMSPQEAGAVGGNIGLLDGSVSWKRIEEMTVQKCSRLGGCYGVW